jgi:DNA-binding NarL/FixJ family response regulator
VTIRSTTVVLADDHALVRAGIRAVLGHVPGIEVVGETGDGLEALRLVERLRPDVLLLDITMPGLNGFEVAGRVRRMSLPTKVLVLSMYTTPEYVARALGAGAAGYLVKDAAVDELSEALDRVLLGRRFLSRAINAEVVDRVLEASNDPDAELAVLTSRQREILQLIAEGESTRSIADKLFVSVKTVETHRAQLMSRLGIHDVAGLVRFAIRTGVVTPDS